MNPTTSPDPLAVSRFRLRLHFAPKAYPSARVTDNRDRYYADKLMRDLGMTPLRQPPARLLSARRSLIMEAVIVWGAVLAVLAWLALR